MILSFYQGLQTYRMWCWGKVWGIGHCARQALVPALMSFFIFVIDWFYFLCKPDRYPSLRSSVVYKSSDVHKSIFPNQNIKMGSLGGGGGTLIFLFAYRS